MTKNIIALGLLLVFAWWTGGYVKQHLHEFRVIAQIPPMTLLTLYALFLGILIANGLIFKHILFAFGIATYFEEYFSLSTASALANYMTFFRGGAGLRALYLKTKYKLPLADFLSTFSVMYLIYFMLNSMTGLLGMILLSFEGVPFDFPLCIGFMILFSSSLIVMVLSPMLPECNRFPLRVIVRIVNGWDRVRRNRNLLLRLIAANMAYLLLIILQTKVAFATYKVSMSWGAAMFFSAAKCLALLVSVTPGSIGIVEWLSVYMANTLPYTPSEALMAQALMRTVTITTLLMIGPFAVHYLNRKIFKKKCLNGSSTE